MAKGAAIWNAQKPTMQMKNGKGIRAITAHNVFGQDEQD
jgi:hypothetical protein